jgi:hypothetical protein
LSGVGQFLCANTIKAGFFSDFVWDGCRDHAPALVLPRLLQFWEAAGAAECRKYMRTLVGDAVELLADAWGSGRGGHGGGKLLAPLAMHGPMALVAVPFAANGAATSTDAKLLQDGLYHNHKVECPVKCVGGVLYVRISCAVYNEIADYVTLAKAVPMVLESRNRDLLHSKVDGDIHAVPPPPFVSALAAGPSHTKIRNAAHF